MHTALGKLALSADNRDVAGSHFREALQAYVAALRAPEALGTLRDRSDTRFACYSLMSAKSSHGAARAGVIYEVYGRSPLHEVLRNTLRPMTWACYVHTWSWGRLHTQETVTCMKMWSNCLTRVRPTLEQAPCHAAALQRW